MLVNHIFYQKFHILKYQQGIVETKGISIKYSKDEKGEEKGICILDSAGFETPLLRDEEYPKEKENNIANNSANDEKENKNNNNPKFEKDK